MFEKNLLEGKVILVTGGGTGLGRSMGERFLSLGARLAIASRNVERLETAAAEMAESTGGEVLPVGCDVRDPESVDRMVETVFGHYGRIDVRYRDGIFYIIDVNPNPDINAETSLSYAAAEEGYTYGELGSRIVNLASDRHPVFQKPGTRDA